MYYPNPGRHIYVFAHAYNGYHANMSVHCSFAYVYVHIYTCMLHRISVTDTIVAVRAMAIAYMIVNP